MPSLAVEGSRSHGSQKKKTHKSKWLWLGCVGLWLGCVGLGAIAASTGWAVLGLLQLRVQTQVSILQRLSTRV